MTSGRVIRRNSFGVLLPRDSEVHEDLFPPQSLVEPGGSETSRPVLFRQPQMLLTSG